MNEFPSLESATNLSCFSVLKLKRFVPFSNDVYILILGARAICKCPRGFTGDPFVRCNDNPCSVDPCGANADCEAQGNRAVCRCREGYEGKIFI